MKRPRIRMLIAVVITLIAFMVAVRWMFGASPYLQYMRLIHDDIPRLVVPVQLAQGVPVTFQARIIYQRSYRLNLLVYFRDKEQRAVVESLIGGPVSQPNNVGQPPGKLPTTFRITVLDQNRHVVLDQTVRSDGRISLTSDFLGRDIGLLPLEEGLSTISVTALSDVSNLAPFQTHLELTYLSK